MFKKKGKGKGDVARIAEQIGEELQRGRGKATDPSAPSIRVMPVDPQGGPPRATPKASARRSKAQIAIERKLLNDEREAEAAVFDKSVVPKSKRQRRSRWVPDAIPGTA